MPVNTENLDGTAGLGRISAITTGQATTPVYSFKDDPVGLYRSGASTTAVSGGTFNLFTNAVRLSVGTNADATAMNIGELRLVFAASGISLMYSSGASVYIIGGSSTSGAQA